MGEQEAMDKFHYRCGFILSLALHVESTLDIFLSRYFCGDDDMLKTFLFTDKLLVNAEYGLNFYHKLRLLSEIAKREEVSIESLKKDLKFIIETRNKVAHYNRMWGGDETTLFPKKSICNLNKEGLTLDNDVMKELNQAKQRIFFGLREFEGKLPGNRNEGKIFE